MERRGSQYSQDAAFRFESSKSLLRFSTPGKKIPPSKIFHPPPPHWGEFTLQDLPLFGKPWSKFDPIKSVLVYETFRKLLKIKYGNNIMKETKQ